MASRINTIGGHLSPSTGNSRVDRLTAKHADDIVVTCAKRTALGKARKGGFSKCSSDELLIATLKAAKQDIGIDPSLVGDICIGTVLTPGAPYAGRAASLTAGFRKLPRPVQADMQPSPPPSRSSTASARPALWPCSRSPTRSATARLTLVSPSASST
jgi:hypothetical protein